MSVSSTSATPDVESTESDQDPVRTCVACRTQQNPDAMIRIVLAPDHSPHVDYLGRLPGRGAYVCPNMRCMEQAVQRGGLQRAFRRPVQTQADALMQQAWSAARKQLRSLLALAHRAGKTLPGHSQVEWGLQQQTGQLLILAHDASPGLQQKYRRWASRLNIPTYEALSKDEMGTCCGSAIVSLVLITEEGFSKKLIQELERSKHLLFIVE